MYNCGTFKDFLLQLNQQMGDRLWNDKSEQDNKIKYRLIRKRKKCCICQDKIAESLNNSIKCRLDDSQAKVQA